MLQKKSRSHDPKDWISKDQKVKLLQEYKE
jgi:hypothetical protein